MKSKHKKVAVKLRKRGLTYSEILNQVPVAKSTLSLWLRSVGLSKKQKQRLTQKKVVAAGKGGVARKKQRIKTTKAIRKKARLEINSIDDEKLWLMGIMLYWAEGSKQNIKNTSQGVYFSNSDSRMIKLYIKWLLKCLSVDSSEIDFNILIHENIKERVKGVIKYWSEVTGFPQSKFNKVYYKKHKLKTNRTNIGDDYFGLLRVIVKKSTNLNRKISGWIDGVCKQCGVIDY